MSGHNQDAPPPASVPPLTGMPPTARETPLHTYRLDRHRMSVGSPLTFSDGERIIAVVSSEPAAGRGPDVDVLMLVELPVPPQ